MYSISVLIIFLYYIVFVFNFYWNIMCCDVTSCLVVRHRGRKTRPGSARCGSKSSRLGDGLVGARALKFSRFVLCVCVRPLIFSDVLRSVAISAAQREDFVATTPHRG